MEAMDTIDALLDELDDLLESSRTVPFSNKVGVDREEILEIIDSIRLNLPAEIKQAQRIVDNCDKIINDANNKAKSIIKEVEEQAERLTSEHEISKRAKEQAAIIIDEAKTSARGMRIGAVEYADELLANTEQVIKETLEEFVKKSRTVEDFLSNEIDIIYDNRQELRGSGK